MSSLLLLYILITFIVCVPSYLHFHLEVTMQAQKKAPPNMHCIDEFLIQSIVTRPGAY
ncbi:hypothetical protein MtrunA17_Chr4g0012201 [Medicago truncatula]|uniref:Transmembrane protein n=1 Tax=Medicago truncatula TaxID=3880 RepID=A0A396I145_MEDTR|nr:hypothetical protein MtrunA17_Chr4g0012201 [Medicago truncatula]